MEKINSERIEALLEATKEGKLRWTECDHPDLGEDTLVKDALLVNFNSSVLRLLRLSMRSTTTGVSAAGAEASGSLQNLLSTSSQYRAIQGLVNVESWITRYRIDVRSANSSRWHRMYVDCDLTDLYEAASANEAKVDKFFDELDKLK